VNVTLNPGWTLQGQMEKGSEGTTHYQGMLTTPQVRFSAVKKLFPRAHIEVAKNKQALQTYVHKDDTRIAEVASRDGGQLITPYNINSMIAERWNDELYSEFYSKATATMTDGEIMLSHVDTVIIGMIRDGIVCEYVGVNPQFRSAWKLYGKAILEREKKRNQEYRDASQKESEDFIRNESSESAEVVEEALAQETNSVIQ